MASEEFIWIVRWDEFQTFQKKRGKPWAPPWVKLYTRILDDPAYLELTPETRSLLVGLWALFGRTRGTVAKDTRRLSQQLHQRVTEGQLKTLNHACFIQFCSGTVLEQKRNAFWNRSALEVEVEENREEPSFLPTSLVDVEQEGRQEENGIPQKRRQPTEFEIVDARELGYEIEGYEPPEDEPAIQLGATIGRDIPL